MLPSTYYTHSNAQTQQSHVTSVIPLILLWANRGQRSTFWQQFMTSRAGAGSRSVHHRLRDCSCHCATMYSTNQRQETNTHVLRVFHTRIASASEHIHSGLSVAVLNTSCDKGTISSFHEVLPPVGSSLRSLHAPPYISCSYAGLIAAPVTG